MDSIIELIYDGIQESSLIQKGRENSQKEVERIAEYIMSNRQLKQEELSDQYMIWCSLRKRRDFVQDVSAEQR